MVTTLIAFALQTTVSGTVHLSNGRPAANAVVLLNGGAHSHPMPKAIVDQRDKTFIPHVSVVTVGTKVDFPNNDTVFHNVFTEFHSTKFDLGMYPRGTTKSKVFNQSGLAVVMCSVHPNMLAYVMVVDTPYYAVTNRSGHFAIQGVPTGDYQLQVWHESGQKNEQSVSIHSGSAVDVDLHG